MFRTGPNGFSFDYTVACYDADTVDCGGVLGGDAVPIDSVSGPLPRDYSSVVNEMTVRDWPADRPTGRSLRQQ